MIWLAYDHDVFNELKPYSGVTSQAVVGVADHLWVLYIKLKELILESSETQNKTLTDLMEGADFAALPFVSKIFRRLNLILRSSQG